jgi:hypothetical protein
MIVRPRALARRSAFACAAFVMLGLAACETGPQAPLLSPLAQTKRYGYAETQRGPDALEVSYLGPTRRTVRFEPDRAADADAARAQSTDMALWRAAQIAQQRGFLGFRVTQTRSSTDSFADPSYDDPFYGPWWGPWRGHRFGYPYPPYPTPSPYATLQPRVSLDVQLRNELAPGDYNAADVIKELRARYPNAETGVAESR